MHYALNILYIHIKVNLNNSMYNKNRIIIKNKNLKNKK